MDDKWQSLHEILRDLYDQMLPLCDSLIDVARAIAGLGALFYIANRVWRNMANNEPINFYPLFRPFVIGWCIMFFPLVIQTMNGILNPVVTATNSLVDTQNVQVREFQEQLAVIESESFKREGNGWMVDDEEFEKKLSEYGTWKVGSIAGMYAERTQYQLKTSLRKWFKETLIVGYEASSLVLDTIRTFFLIVLAIIGPISFGLSVFDGFKGTLSHWMARYITVFLWLPVANIFGAIIGRINVLMLQKDLADLRNGGDFDATNTAYLIFLVIGIFGYCCVPTVSSWIVQSTGGGRFIQRITNTTLAAASNSSAAAGAAGGAIAGRAAVAAKNLASAPGEIINGYKKL